MSERNISFVLMRSKLATEPEGPAAQHNGLPVAPTVDQHGNQWVVLAVDNGSGSGTSTQLEAGFDNADNRPNFSQVGIDANGLAVVNHPFLANIDPNGIVADGWDRWQTASAQKLLDFTAKGSALVTTPGEFATHHTPAAGVKASLTNAAVAPFNKNIKGVSFGFNAVVAEAGTFIVNLINGNSGGASILQSWRVGPFAANTFFVLNVSDLNIPADQVTAVTLEFTVAPNAANFEWVNLRTYAAE